MIDFLEVQNSVRKLKDQLAAHQIDEKTLEDRLLELIDKAEDGYYWMFGHKSERWFRHDGQKWVPDDPTELLTVRSQESTAIPDHSTDTPNDALDDRPLNWTWLIVSVLIIIGIGWIVYLSTLG